MLGRRRTEGGSPRPVLMLLVTMLGQSAATLFVQGAPFLVPHLHHELGLSLWQSGLVVSAPVTGMMLTLYAWGVVADRVGERFALVAGLTIMTACGVAAALASSIVVVGVLLMAGGMGGASVNSAGGRVVMGWFPPERRGFVMGIRQTAQLLGVGLAALVIPLTIQAGLAVTMGVVAALCGFAALLTFIVIVDPPREPGSGAESSSKDVSPYGRDRRLWRIHAASMFLSVPQMAVTTYALIWLVDERSFTAGAAGVVLALTQLWGAAGRIGAGWWSDRLGLRLWPMRIIAMAIVVTLVAFGMLEGTILAVALLLVAAVVTVAYNGLALVAVAELGGTGWAARAMGAQNTAQFLAAAATPPLLGLSIAAFGYGWSFVLVALAAGVAVPLIPVRSEGRRRGPEGVPSE